MSSYASDPRFPGPDPYAPLRDLPDFPLTSADFGGGDAIPDTYVAPANVSPQLAWSGLPEGTKSIAVTMFDPDAPTASGFWHWAAFNIPATVTELPTGAGLADQPLLGLDETVTLRGDSGIRGYYGPTRPPVTAPTATCLPFTRSTWTGSTFPQTPPPPCWVLTCTTIPSPAPCTGAGTATTSQNGQNLRPVVARVINGVGEG